MRILLLYPFFPHPNADHGGGQVICQRQKHLPSTVEVTLVSFIHPSEKIHLPAAQNLFHAIHTVPRLRNADLSQAALLAQRARILAALARSAKPFLMIKFYARSMARLVEQVASAGNFHLIHVEHSYMTQYLPAWWKKPCILIEHEPAPILTLDALKQGAGFKRFLLLRDLARWRAYVRKTYPRFTRVLAVTEKDQQALRELVPGLRVGLWPLGIEAPSLPAPPLCPGEGRIVFFGNYTHKPNVDAAIHLAKEVFPPVRARFPQAMLHLAGPHPPQEVRALEEEPHVVVPGFVEDMDQYLQKAAVIAAPLRLGGGLRIKNLKALSLGLPLVTSSLGAEGICGRPGRDYLVADNAESFSEALLSLLTDADKRKQLGINGRSLMEKEFFWQARVDKMMEIYREVLEAPPSKSSS